MVPSNEMACAALILRNCFAFMPPGCGEKVTGLQNILLPEEGKMNEDAISNKKSLRQLIYSRHKPG